MPIVLAALRDRMLRLGGELADGTFMNFLPLSAAEHVVARVREGEAAAGRDETEVDLPLLLHPRRRDRHRALHVRRLRDGAGLRGVLPRARLGRGDRPDGRARGAAATARRALGRGAGGARARDLHLRRRRPAMRARLGEYAARGITTLVLTPIAAARATLPELIDALAP